jgi:hypothetical protein
MESACVIGPISKRLRRHLTPRISNYTESSQDSSQLCCPFPLLQLYCPALSPALRPTFAHYLSCPPLLPTVAAQLCPKALLTSFVANFAAQLGRGLLPTALLHSFIARLAPSFAARLYLEHCCQALLSWLLHN